MDAVQTHFHGRAVLLSVDTSIYEGKFRDQGDAKCIVTRRLLWGHNDTPCGRSASGQPIGCPGAGHALGLFGGIYYY
jgi:hypothetical protein